jgi:hypothetical protein
LGRQAKKAVIEKLPPAFTGASQKWKQTWAGKSNFELCMRIFDASNDQLKDGGVAHSIVTSWRRQMDADPERSRKHRRLIQLAWTIETLLESWTKGV